DRRSATLAPYPFTTEGLWSSFGVRVGPGLRLPLPDTCAVSPYLEMATDFPPPFPTSPLSRGNHQGPYHPVIVGLQELRLWILRRVPRFAFSFTRRLTLPHETGCPYRMVFVTLLPDLLPACQAGRDPTLSAKKC